MQIAFSKGSVKSNLSRVNFETPNFGFSAHKAKGATSVMACCTHGVLSGQAFDRIDQGALDELVITDTIPHSKASTKVTVLSVANIFGEVIRRVYHNESVNSLFIV